ncbi:MAG TPA: ABC transporter permease [Trueperaceae bacterium]|nr:ABC transporter permease [Trueperaceae bacterium]
MAAGGALRGVAAGRGAMTAAGRRALALVALTALGVAVAFAAVALQRGRPGAAGPLYWAALLGGLLLAVLAAARLSLQSAEDAADRAGAALVARLQRVLPVATVPFVLLLTWEGLVLGFRVPAGIFPSVASIGQALVRAWPVLVADAYLTFVREVLFGFALGLLLGFVTGTLIAFSTFLRRGFLPLATAFGAVPIVGLAPVLGRALGVDWESKAAVGVIVTFFPVVLNTVQGLTSVEPLKLELLRSYAARPLQGFLALRLPNALPYVFTSLKVAIVLTVVSVIVAEFLIPGPPSGLGQRISLSAHRGQFDVVFAAIFVSSVLSMLLYWTVQLLERWLLAWHPSSRGG